MVNEILNAFKYGYGQYMKPNLIEDRPRIIASKMQLSMSEEKISCIQK